ncbi:MAG: ATP-dependent DNA helicase RecG [Planctomycetes bacterium]|nr:ATP-dependent DNA helicase RecG [Planctomycetota bacterium]
MLQPDSELQFLKGVGPARARLLAKLGLATVADLLLHFPREWQDRRVVTPIRDLVPEATATVRATVVRTRVREGTGRGPRRVLVLSDLDDGTGVLRTEFWQQRFRAEQLVAGREVLLSGRVTWDDGPKMAQPEVETHVDESGERIHAERIVPIHPLTKGIWPTGLRAAVWRALEATDAMEDPVPRRLCAERGFPDLATALRSIHFPDSFEARDAAVRRFKYEELFLLEVILARRRMRHALEEKPHRIAVDERLDARIRARFPFPLTKAQDRVVAEIRSDLASPQPMHRLLQGDVGSGKTAVAVYAMLAAVASRMQAALLAPTEILAEQHLATLTRWLQGSQVRLRLLAGSAGETEKREARAAVIAGDVDIVIGTHALLEDDVRFARLGLVVVDEQHKFGVIQRGTLTQKGLHPDLLVMSATPIPRTLTMTLFGDLDVSILDEKPPGRAPVTTVLCGEGDREQAYEWVRSEIARGRRVFHVVPLVEDNEELPLKSAVSFAEELRRDVFPGVGVGLMHGRLTTKEKDAAMAAFRDGRTPVLVATSVVEVGVDVPEATVLLVEHAERFGLAQLHQLRGRIGRGKEPGRVILFHQARTAESKARLRAIAGTDDGFVIAEEDLRIRGPGEFVGTRQHGLPELRVADLTTDVRILEQARDDAFALVRADPALKGEGAPVARAIEQRFGRRLRTLDA